MLVKSLILGVDYDLSFVPTGVHSIIALKAVKYEFKNVPPRFSCNDKVNKSYSRLLCVEVSFLKNSHNVLGMFDETGRKCVQLLDGGNTTPE